MLKGVTVILHEKTETGTNSFNETTYTETEVSVNNVLVYPADSQAVVDEFQISGRHLSYEMAIPKGDTHNWDDSIVEFFGQKWRTFGGVTQGIEAMIPLSWNKKIKVERYE